MLIWAPCPAIVIVEACSSGARLPAAAGSIRRSTGSSAARPAPTRSRGEHYFTFRLVRSERSGSQVRQRTLLNLGRHFAVARSDWPLLCRRIKELLAGQLALPQDSAPTLEAHAERIAAQLLAQERVGTAAAPAQKSRDLQHVDVRFTRRPVRGSMLTHPGVYCLRSNQTDWDDAALWRTYTTLTDIEAVFRSLKSELGLRPIFHQKPIRADGHLFISVIAYQLVQVIRTRLRQYDDNSSWTTLRRILEGQQRVTATFRRPDDRTLHVPKATRAEPLQQAIYDALGIDFTPGGVRKTLV